MVRKSTIKFYSRFVLVYMCSCATVFILLFIKGNWEILLKDEYAPGMTILQIVYFYFYKYVLNFPFGIMNWLSDKRLATTLLFMVPDSLFVAWLIARYFPSDKKDIAKYLYYVCIALLVVNFFAVMMGFIKGDLLQRFS